MKTPVEEKPKKWNPRYACYAKAHKRSPEKQLKQDKKDWPGGCMVGYIQWNSDKLMEFYKVSPKSFYTSMLYPRDRPVLLDGKAYDAWLPANLN